MTMKRYHVRIPFTGVLRFEINAESEEAAIEAALDSNVGLEVVAGSNTDAELDEWEMTTAITRGSIFYGVQNRAEAEEVDEDD